MTEQEALNIFTTAQNEGMAKGNACIPTPMGIMTEIIADGVCGFAWIKINGNTSFARIMRKHKFASTSCTGGTMFWASEFGQSMQKKVAYAHAFANVLKLHNIEAKVDSRMD